MADDINCLDKVQQNRRLFLSEGDWSKQLFPHFYMKGVRFLAGSVGLKTRQSDLQVLVFHKNNYICQITRPKLWFCDRWRWDQNSRKHCDESKKRNCWSIEKLSLVVKSRPMRIFRYIQALRYCCGWVEAKNLSRVITYGNSSST